jgi:hypothetical protein
MLGKSYGRSGALRLKSTHLLCRPNCSRENLSAVATHPAILAAGRQVCQSGIGAAVWVAKILQCAAFRSLASRARLIAGGDVRLPDIVEALRMTRLGAKPNVWFHPRLRSGVS